MQRIKNSPKRPALLVDQKPNWKCQHMAQIMKTNQHTFYLFALILLAGVFHLQAADSSNAPASFQESWGAISNHWGSVPIEKIKHAAETNEFTAQYYLGNVYRNGTGVTNDDVEAFKWMKLAAQQGMARAQRKLGEMLDNGTGVEKNVAEAFGWYQKAAQQADAWAQVDLGWDYQSGIGTDKNVGEAFGWYQKSADQGNAQAQMNLGWMYEHGVGVSQDYAEASKFYRLAAEQGHAIAQNNLGLLYFYFHEGVPQNSEEGIKWFQKAAEQGEPLAEENLARAYAMDEYTNLAAAETWMRKAVDLNSAEGQYKFADFLCSQFDQNKHQITTNFPAAAEWYRKAAEQGLAKAQYELADMYRTGELGEDQRSNCIPWFLKAAAQGNAKAQAVVGGLSTFYPNSELLKSVNNIEILRQSGEQGNLDAQFQLAQRYHTGNGVPKDAGEAFKWMQKASQHDQRSNSRVSDALYDLALMYEQGDGVTQDLSEAHNLFIQAADGHQEDATFRVGQMYEKGDGVPQDDHRAMEFYCNKFYNMNYPEKYPNGYVEYGPFGARDAEGFLRLWSQGRGFQNEKDKAEPGNYESAYFIGCAVNFALTSKAQFYLGEIYHQGKLVPQDLVEAAAWFQLSANLGSDEARKSLDELEPNLSLPQRGAVQSRYKVIKNRIEQAK